MAESHREPNYMGVWFWLLVLTIIEIAVALMPLTALAKGSLLVVMALIKAGLVALYFMHLRFERVTLGVIVLTPLIICVFLVFMLLPDLGAVNKSGVSTEQVGTGR